MKKFLVLALVLGIASLATADLALTLEGETGLISAFEGLEIVSDGDLDLSAVVGIATSGYDLKVTVTGDLTIDTSAVSFPGAGSIWLFGNTFVGTPTDTDARFTGGHFGSVAVDTAAFSGVVIKGTSGTIIFDEIVNDGSHALATVTVVPEPATLALLGLGALVLRRKK